MMKQHSRWKETNKTGYLMLAPFSMVPNDYDSNNPPSIGAMLKVEENTNISLYTLSSTVTHGAGEPSQR